MRHAFALDDDGRLLYPELCYSAPKKSGKTTLAALVVLTMVLLRNEGRFSEGYVIANDLEQAVSRVFTLIKRIVACSPLLKHEARVTADRISFPALNDASIRGGVLGQSSQSRRQFIIGSSAAAGRLEYVGCHPHLAVGHEHRATGGTRGH
jgi:hypothetical protein